MTSLDWTDVVASLDLITVADSLRPSTVLAAGLAADGELLVVLGLVKGEGGGDAVVALREPVAKGSADGGGLAAVEGYDGKRGVGVVGRGSHDGRDAQGEPEGDGGKEHGGCWSSERGGGVCGCVWVCGWWRRGEEPYGCELGACE